MQKRIMGPVDRARVNITLRCFLQLIYGLVCPKSTAESRENTVVSAAIYCRCPYCHEEVQHVWHKCRLHREPTLSVLRW